MLIYLVQTPNPVSDTNLILNSSTAQEGIGIRNIFIICNILNLNKRAVLLQSHVLRDF